ncbi:mCG145971, partial [Mus musculus]
ETNTSTQWVRHLENNPKTNLNTNLAGFLFIFILSVFMCINVWASYVCSRCKDGSSGTRVTDSHEPPCRRWEPWSSPRATHAHSY